MMPVCLPSGGMVLPFPVRARARVEVQRVHFPIGELLDSLRRTLAWLECHQVVIVAFSCSTRKGVCVHAAGTHRLRQILGDEAISRGHRESGAGRVESFAARDRFTGVLIAWEERQCCG